MKKKNKQAIFTALGKNTGANNRNDTLWTCDLAEKKKRQPNNLINKSAICSAIN